MVVVTQAGRRHCARFAFQSGRLGISASRRSGLGRPGLVGPPSPWLNRLALLALVAFVTMLGTTACAPRYDYYNHGPPIPPATPAGNYNVIVTAQSSNGVTAITNNANLALTVQ
jgi:hypothetical protein